MKGGRERPIMRWAIRQHLLEREIEAIRARLEADTLSPVLTTAERADLEQRLSALRARRRQMGPSPHARMG